MWSGQATDYFAPTNWKNLDNADLDMSGTGPLVVDAVKGRIIVAGDNKVYVYKPM